MIVPMPMIVIVIVIVIVRMMMTILGMAMGGDRAVGMLHAPVRQMGMVVIVAVDGKRFRRPATEEFPVFGAAADILRRAAAADVTVEADDRVVGVLAAREVGWAVDLLPTFPTLIPQTEKESQL